MFRQIISILLITSFIYCLPISAQKDRGAGNRVKTGTEKRTALVIGNGKYTKARTLDNPVNDANDMTNALREVGFEVISGIDLNLKQMTDKVREFGDKLKAGGGVGLFYYAGHGIQANGKNYLIPVEADISREDEIDFSALNFEIVLRKMATANNGLNIVVLDACRNNPFARSWSRDASDGGLAQVSAPTGTFIAYATAPDKTASDGTGRNGLYTGELLKYIKQPNLTIEETFKEVRKAVKQASGDEQIPWDSSSLSGDFYFKPTTESVKPPTGEKEPVIVAKDKAAQEREAWDLVKNSTSASDFRYYLEEFPNGANAANAKIRLEELVWQTVRGAGKEKIQAYLKEFPNGANAAAARIRLRQLEAAATPPEENPPNSNNAGTVTAGTVQKNGIGMELVYIPAGSFMMGSPDSEKDRGSDEGPVHKVTIRDGFWMGKYEVTQTQYESVMGTNPSNFKNCANCPVDQVSWNDAKEFIQKMNSKNDGFVYSLPSEAQWEYAARAGTTTAFSFGDSLSSSQANFDGNYPYGGAAKGQYLQKTSSVGSYQANAWGLYDMHGNVYEWCEDIYNEKGYANLPTDGSANMSVGDSSVRVLRGGSWFFNAQGLRSADRYGNAPTFRNVNFGFRVVARPK